MALDRVPGHPKLYIGGLFSLKAREARGNANITHVLSLLGLPLSADLFEGCKHLVIDIDDDEDSDIIQHFPASNAFIQDGLDHGDGVFVHCAMGKSRSAAIIIAYLLSTIPSLTPLSALTSLRESHPLAEPNPGFFFQLELYHRMQCPQDPETHPFYQRWCWEREVQRSIACGQAPEGEKIRFGDEVRATGNDGGVEQIMEFRCRRCRAPLATSVYLVPHDPSTTSPPSSYHSKRPSAAAGEVKRGGTPATCAHLFLEPLSWMRPELEQGKLDGRLECPNAKCTQNVGKYAWQGIKCSCGSWVVPGISIGRGKVDEVRKKPGVGAGGGGHERM